MAEARGRLRVATSDKMLKWCHVGIHVTAGAADVQILAEARRIGADLIAMGITLRTSAQPPVFGSIVGRVAAQANSPVLVVKASADSPSWETEYSAPGDDLRSNADEARNSHVALTVNRNASMSTKSRSTDVHAR
jgi:hypothetical protein